MVCFKEGMKFNIIRSLKRKKTFDHIEDSNLPRVLSLLDLSCLGVGSTLGLGIYVLGGSVAKSLAGPAVCISFVVAGIASGFAALCYAEFAARVPKAGSAYIYSYVTIGEFVAYVIGWNLILEYVIGAASIARGLSHYIDALVERKITQTFEIWMPMNVNFLAPYPDFLSALFILILTGILTTGVKESAKLAKILTFLNLSTIAIIIIAGSINADVYNWNIPLDDIPVEHRGQAGNGGFVPFGVSGIMAGAARCFFGFVGFDSVAAAGEEAKFPQRDIPLSIFITLIIVCGAYLSIAIVLTMAWPYYLQDDKAPFPYVFENLGWIEIKWIVTIGAIFAICCCLLGAMFPLTRVVYAMSSDGLMFKPLAKINVWLKTPLVATVTCGLITALMAAIFDLEQLVDTMTIATLAVYSMVAVCVLALRYEPELNNEVPEKVTNIFVTVFNLRNKKSPSETSSRIAKWSIILFSFFSALFCVTLVNEEDILRTTFSYSLFIPSLLFLLLALLVLIKQPMNTAANIYFKVPLVPYIPCLSIMFNLYLIMKLDPHTWIRYSIWLGMGLLIYLFYGIRHSNENKNKIINVSMSEARN